MVYAQANVGPGEWHTLNFDIQTDHIISARWPDLIIIKVTVIPIVIGALGTVTKGLVQGLEDLEIRERVEIIQTTALLRSVRILRKVPETWEDLLSFKL